MIIKFRTKKFLIPFLSLLRLRVPQPKSPNNVGAISKVITAVDFWSVFGSIPEPLNIRGTRISANRKKSSEKGNFFQTFSFKLGRGI